MKPSMRALADATATRKAAIGAGPWTGHREHRVGDGCDGEATEHDGHHADRLGRATGQVIPDPEQHDETLRSVDPRFGVQALPRSPGAGDGEVSAFVGAQRCRDEPGAQRDRDEDRADDRARRKAICASRWGLDIPVDVLLGRFKKRSVTVADTLWSVDSVVPSGQRRVA